MPSQTTRADRWRRRPLAGLAVRAVILLLPFAMSLAAVIILGRTVPRPHGATVVLWYAGICAFSWGLLWLAQRLLTRLLPLAALLEMALVFPDQAPSRTQLARRAGSNRELRQLLDAPESRREESVQQAAERVLALVGALARHDRKTRGHAERVRALTDLIAERMGLPETHRDRLRWAALLHDIAKLHISHELLNKPGKPDAHEWDLLKQHPEHGARIVAPLMEWLDGWGDVVVQHHERWDGTGYPHGLAGTEITIGARIVAVADAYDVMTSNRAYKKPVGRAAALRELVDCGGSQFDPEVVRAMLAVSGRRLVAALGPLSWLSGLPFVGQTTAMATTVATQAGGALGVAAVAGAVAIAPVPTPHPAPTPAAHDAVPGAVQAAADAAGTQPSIAAQSSPQPHGEQAHHPHGSAASAHRQHRTSHRSAASHGRPTATPHPTPTSSKDDHGSSGSGSGADSGSGSGPGGSSHTGSSTRKTGTPTPSQSTSDNSGGDTSGGDGSGDGSSATTTPQPTPTSTASQPRNAG
ncbi:MAG TPA: HD-GYP domain-containing protein [Mycobacteriales bacterium]|nr:HD-GYP domain-containing protein [Mycobacteriales bacterium]